MLRRGRNRHPPEVTLGSAQRGANRSNDETSWVSRDEDRHRFDPLADRLARHDAIFICLRCVLRAVRQTRRGDSREFPPRRRMFRA